MVVPCVAKDFSKAFYQSKAWKDTRLSFLKYKHYECERCGKGAKIVHHKKHLTRKNINDLSVSLAWDNLEALCQECHNNEHLKKNKNTADGLMFDESGNLVKACPPIRQKNKV